MMVAGTSNSNILEKILPLYNKFSGCDYHRIMSPLKHMGYELTAKSKEELDKVRLVLFNRVPHRLDLVKQTLTYGVKLVMDLDDYWFLYPEHPLYPWWNKVGMAKQLETLMREVAAVTCTTELLAEKIYPLNNNVHVIPNAIPFEGQFLRNEVSYTPTGTRYGYVGGSSHLADIKRITSVFNHFPTLDFTLFGYQALPPGYPGKNVWDKIEATCNFGGHNPNFKKVNSKGLDNYMEHYDKIDVAIAPLKDTPFNTFKSSLKFYEAGVKKCVFIASDMAPYSVDVPRKFTFLCKSNKDWVEAIKKCKDPGLVAEYGQASFEWVKEHRNLDKINQLRTDLYTSLLN